VLTTTVMRWVSPFWVGIALASTPPTRPVERNPGKAVDGVRILEVLPSTLVVGEEQDVYVRVRYELKSLEQATLSLAFNTTDSARYRRVAAEVVAHGTGETVLAARVVPRAWGEFVFFQAAVSLGEMMATPPRPAPGQTSVRTGGRPALAFDHAPIPLKTRTP